MTKPPELKKKDRDELVRRLEQDLIDGYDEELELEIEDHYYEGIGDADQRALHDGTAPAERIERQTYFSELFRLQGELVKLQDWVVATQAQGRDPVRGARRRRQGRRHQAHHAAPEPTRLHAWWRCPRPTIANARSGTSSATCRTCPRPARSCSSTAAGTTAPASNA